MPHVSHGIRAALRGAVLASVVVALGACGAPVGSARPERVQASPDETPSGPEVCTTQLRAAVASALRVRLGEAAPTTTGVMSLPGVEPVRARLCVIRVSGKGPVRAVSVRSVSAQADVLFRTLGRYDSPGLVRLGPEAALPTGVEGYWQPVGTSAWLRNRERLVSVQVATDEESDSRLRTAVLTIGLTALTSP